MVQDVGAYQNGMALAGEFLLDIVYRGRRANSIFGEPTLYKFLTANDHASPRFQVKGT